MTESKTVSTPIYDEDANTPTAEELAQELAKELMPQLFPDMKENEDKAIREQWIKARQEYKVAGITEENMDIKLASIFSFQTEQQNLFAKTVIKFLISSIELTQDNYFDYIKSIFKNGGK